MSSLGPLGPIGVLAPSKSNSEVNSTSYYKESTALQYSIQIQMRRSSDLWPIIHYMQTSHELMSIN